MEKVVRFQVLCPPLKGGLLRGRQHSTVMNIRAQTRSRVSINPVIGWEIVTFSAVETLENGSPSVDALLAMLPYFRDFKCGLYEVSLLVEEEQRSCLAEDFLVQWMQQTLTSIVVSEYNTYIRVQIFGGNHGVSNALSLIVTSLRQNVFN
ncbi:unnamed protein product [Arabidopsis arenosa]|uniref:Uncharacterized protein n=1 Tax=Arabidopsis arenosa TaxID=38785 RepID=A0A8S1ZCS7_ARAAE|nr:unnamed protein product [Arabidopsis arenosa]